LFERKINDYVLPHNLKTHQFQGINYGAIKECPMDVIVVSFPHERIPGSIGCNRIMVWRNVPA
jgi:hypothetical protein